MKVNLSNHLAIGFQEQWLRMQGIANRNLAEVLHRDCKRQGVDVVGISSEVGRKEIREVDRRFERILRNAFELEKTGRFLVEEIDASMFYLKRIGCAEEENPVYVVRTQVVQALGPDGTMKRPSKFLVFGGRRYVPDCMSLEDTFESTTDMNALVIAQNPAEDGINSPRAEQFRKCVYYLDGVVGFDAQKSVKSNKDAKDFSINVGRNWVAIGNQHSPSRCGAGIITPDNASLHSTVALTSYLRNMINEGAYKPVEEREGRLTKLRWMMTFALGTIGDRHYSFS